MTASLSNSLVTAKSIELEEVSVFHMPNLETDCWHIGCRWKVSCSYRRKFNDAMPIQLQLSQKSKNFSQFLGACLQSTRNLNIFNHKMTLIGFAFSKLRTAKTWSDKSLKSPNSEDPSTSNKVNVPKHCSPLHQSIFIIFIDHCQVNWVDKSLFFGMPNLVTAC